MAKDNIEKADILSNATRQRIINETLRLIKATPGTGPSLMDICAAAGVSKRTFYYYFRSTDDVISEVSRVVDASVINALSEHKEAVSTTDYVRRIVLAIVESCEGFGEEVASVHYNLLISNQSKILIFESLPGWRSMLALITKGKEDGDIVCDQTPEEITKCCYYLLRGICLTWGIYKGNFDYKSECINQLNGYLNLIEKK